MEKLTIQELKEKMEKLKLFRCDYVLRNISLDEAVETQKELIKNFTNVKLWGYPNDCNTGNYGWTVEV